MYHGLYDFRRRQEENDVTVPQPFWPIFLGLLVNYFLWGILITQSYYYYRYYRKTDRAWLKATVGLLFIIDAMQSIIASEGAWRTLSKELKSNANDQPPENDWGLNVTPFIDAVTASIVHLFYAQKIWMLLSTPFNYIFTGLVVFLSCFQLVARLIWTVFFFFSSKPNASDLHRIKIWSYVCASAALATDIVITSLITWKLSKSRTGYKHIDDIICKLIRFIVERGLTITVLQLVILILCILWPFGTYAFFPAIISAKIYSNSMLALLNSRRRHGKSVVLHMNNGQMIETFNIHTTQSVDTASDYEVSRRQAIMVTPLVRSHNEQFIAVDAESVRSLSFRNTDRV